ncbi:hypothetical protein GCM10010327_63190 [Streptomyces nitrosporeus]|nr:hypothetical protein GCM10010327_63190 [Streptomyces nitrosporeus]
MPSRIHRGKFGQIHPLEPRESVPEGDEGPLVGGLPLLLLRRTLLDDVPVELPAAGTQLLIALFVPSREQDGSVHGYGHAAFPPWTVALTGCQAIAVRVLARACP